MVKKKSYSTTPSGYYLKVINGKKYIMASSYDDKSKAQKNANFYRKAGDSVRIVKMVGPFNEKKRYYVWQRPRMKKR